MSSGSHEFISWCLRELDKTGPTACEVELLFLAGREFADCDSLWEEGAPIPGDWARARNIYLVVTHRARRAALCFAAGCRVWLGRDMTMLVGKTMLASRSQDAYQWLLLGD